MPSRRQVGDAEILRVATTFAAGFVRPAGKDDPVVIMGSAGMPNMCRRLTAKSSTCLAAVTRNGFTVPAS